MKSKNNTPPALLTDITAPKTYMIKMQLQNSQWAEMTFSDRDMARNHFDLLRTVGVLGGSAIREIVFQQQ